MNCRKRNFVVEIERTQLVRRISESRLVICAECRAESDFISLRQAAALFSTDSAKLFEFIKDNSSHYKADQRGVIFICLTSFIDAINNKTKNPTVKFLGEVKNETDKI